MTAIAIPGSVLVWWDTDALLGALRRLLEPVSRFSSPKAPAAPPPVVIPEPPPPPPPPPPLPPAPAPTPPPVPPIPALDHGKTDKIVRKAYADVLKLDNIDERYEDWSTRLRTREITETELRDEMGATDRGKAIAAMPKGPDAAADKAADAERTMLTKRRGRASTIASSPLGVSDPAPTVQPTLLGQGRGKSFLGQ